MAFVSLKEKTLCQGATYVDQLSITDDNGDAIDLTADYSALFQIRSKPVDDPGSTAYISLTDGDGIVLSDGLLSITLAGSDTETVVSSAGISKLWAELDLTNTDTGEITTFQWPLKVIREYAREEV